MSDIKYGMKVHPDGASPGDSHAQLHQELSETVLGLPFLHRETTLRKLMYRTAKSRLFDNVILFFIVFNSLCMAMTDYRIGCLGRNPNGNYFGEPDPNRCGRNGFVDFMNENVFFTVFVVEAFIKTCGLGFYWEGEHTYLRDPWNGLDFVCVMASVIARVAPSAKPVQTLRLFRLLRPLKSLSKFPGLKKIVSTFLVALPRLWDVVILMSFVLLFFSIVCMQFYKGLLHYRCRITSHPTRVPSTWYTSCTVLESGPGCVNGKFFPGDEEFDAYKALMLEWNVRNAEEWRTFVNASEYEALVAGWGWEHLEKETSDWVCSSPEFPYEQFPEGVPTTAEYANKYSGSMGVEGNAWGADARKMRSGDRAKRCLWLVDESDERPCSLPGNGGKHQCYANARQQRGRFHLADDFDDAYKADPVLQWEEGMALASVTVTPSENATVLAEHAATQCGSNYDEFGNRRFKMAPKLYVSQRGGWGDVKQGVNHGTIPLILDDFSRISSGLFKTLYPEYVGGLNFGYTNFDNIGSAMLAMFQSVTMEGWTDIMYHCMDANMPFIAIFWFLLLFFVGSMLVLNLVLGVITDTLSDEEDAEEEAEAEAAAAASAAGIVQVHADDEDEPDPIEGFSPARIALYNFATGSVMSYFIYACIGVNTLALCLDDYPRAFNSTLKLEILNLTLTFVFIVEMVVKIAAMGWGTYSRDSFNCFDCFIVVISILGMIFNVADVSFSGGAISALRCFRVFRVFKLFKSWTSFQVLLDTMYQTAKEIVWFVILLVIFIFIFALMGMQFFANQMRFDENTEGKIKFATQWTDSGPGMAKGPFWDQTRRDNDRMRVTSAYKDSAPPDLNFDDFGAAMVTVFGILTGESWNLVMYDLMRSRGHIMWGVAYMMLTIWILAFFVMNMFLAILLSNFEDNENLSQPPPNLGNASQRFSEHSSQRFQSLRHVAKTVSKARRISDAVDAGASPRSACAGEDRRALTTMTPALARAFDRAKHPNNNNTTTNKKQLLLTSRDNESLSSSTNNAEGGRCPLASSSSSTAAAEDSHSSARAVTLHQDSSMSSSSSSPDHLPAAAAAPPRKPLSRKTSVVNVDKRPEWSLFVFSRENPVREVCRKITTDPKYKFDQIIVGCILVGALTMCMQSPLMDQNGAWIKFFEALDWFFTLVYFLEFALKVVNLGFVYYISDAWNKLDFGIVLISLIGFMPDLDSLGALKVLRAFRVFRPLRMLSRYPGLKLVLNSLIVAVPNALNVMVVCACIMFIFAIMGVGFFKGQMNMCDTGSYGGEGTMNPGWDDETLLHLIERPIHLKKAIKTGAYDLLVNATPGAITCWASWDERYVNGKDYFNVRTNVAPQGAHQWEKHERPSFVTKMFTGNPSELRLPRNGVAASTAAFFATRPWATNRMEDSHILSSNMLSRGGNLDKYIPTSKDMCRCIFREENAWMNPMYMDFDNVFNAFSLLFEIYSTEGWLDYMFYNIDANGVEMQPIRDHNYREQRRSMPRFYAYFFHLMFQLIGGFFAMQLFVGVIIEQFSKLREEAIKEGRTGVLMTASQEQWVKTQQFIMQRIKPRHKIRPKIVAFHYVVEGPHKATFESFITACILMNGAIMSFEFFGQPKAMTVAIEVLNHIFASIFFVECGLKIGGIGWPQYVADKWNQVDFFIVVGTAFGICLQLAGLPLPINRVMSVIRLVRILRLVRLLNKQPNLKKQVGALLSALPQMGNVGVVLMIFILIWSVLLVELFAHVQYTDTIHPNANFQHVMMSILTLLRFTTGENWNGFMHEMDKKWKDTGCWGNLQFVNIREKMYKHRSGGDDLTHWVSRWCTNLDGGDRPTCPCASFERDGALKSICQDYASFEDCCVPLSGCGDKWWGGVIIHLFDLGVTGVVLNLFVGIILDAYAQEDAEEELGLSAEDLETFVDDWSKFDETATWHIKVSQLKEFIQILDDPMGFGEKYIATDDELELEILRLNLNIRRTEILEDALGNSRLHIMDVAIALGKRLMAARDQDTGYEADFDTGASAQIRGDVLLMSATPLLEEYFGKSLSTAGHLAHDKHSATARAASAFGTDARSAAAVLAKHPVTPSHQTPQGGRQKQQRQQQQQQHQPPHSQSPPATTSGKPDSFDLTPFSDAHNAKPDDTEHKCGDDDSLDVEESDP